MILLFKKLATNYHSPEYNFFQMEVSSEFSEANKQNEYSQEKY